MGFKFVMGLVASSVREQLQMRRQCRRGEKIGVEHGAGRKTEEPAPLHFKEDTRRAMECQSRGNIADVTEVRRGYPPVGRSVLRGKGEHETDDETSQGSDEVRGDLG